MRAVGLGLVLDTMIHSNLVEVQEAAGCPAATSLLHVLGGSTENPARAYGYAGAVQIIMYLKYASNDIGRYLGLCTRFKIGARYRV